GHVLRMAEHAGGPPGHFVQDVPVLPDPLPTLLRHQAHPAAVHSIGAVALEVVHAHESQAVVDEGAEEVALLAGYPSVLVHHSLTSAHRGLCGEDRVAWPSGSAPPP